MCRASADCAMSMVRFITSKLPSFGTCSADSGVTGSASSSPIVLNRLSQARAEGVSSNERAALVSSREAEVLRHNRFHRSAVERTSGSG